MSIIISLPFDGRETMATVCESDCRHREIFKVIFSNEYENIFYRDVENGKWVEEDLGYTDLARLVGSKLIGRLAGPVHVPKLLNWHTEVWNGTPCKFGFTCTPRDEERIFEIYDHRKKYMYSLVENESDGWEILGNQDIMHGRIDSCFLDLVLSVLSEFSTDNA